MPHGGTNNEPHNNMGKDQEVYRNILIITTMTVTGILSFCIVLLWPRWLTPMRLLVFLTSIGSPRRVLIIEFYIKLHCQLKYFVERYPNKTQIFISFYCCKFCCKWNEVCEIPWSTTLQSSSPLPWAICGPAGEGKIVCFHGASSPNTS